ncbi:hypothetical protein [Persicobacter diffluens]|uniref:Uncharacterized protein n=1 Tax=Persicobacter diffluens TaxID=981 RepID=A0AAN5AIX5_9BACT|nr:hypothetical protein PEDI_15370 [Persicobacter diffluens]
MKNIIFAIVILIPLALLGLFDLRLSAYEEKTAENLVNFTLGAATLAFVCFAFVRKFKKLEVASGKNIFNYFVKMFRLLLGTTFVYFMFFLPVFIKSVIFLNAKIGKHETVWIEGNVFYRESSRVHINTAPSSKEYIFLINKYPHFPKSGPFKIEMKKGFLGLLYIQ